MNYTYTLMGILASGPSYGYQLKQRYDLLFGADKPLHFGQVYATLSRLLRDRKVTETESAESEGPSRKSYQLTATGKDELKCWLRIPEVAQPAATTMMFSKIVSAILLGHSPVAYLDAQKALHLARMRELTQIKLKGSLYERLRADYDMSHLDADVRWMDATAQRLELITQEVKHVALSN